MINSKQDLDKRLRELSDKPEYKFYLEARDAVLTMMENNPNKGEFASKYWQEELDGFEYLFDASPLIVSRWRHQCYHVSGQHEYDYREHHQHKSKKLVKNLSYLKSKYGTNLLVPESLEMGGHGYLIDGKKYNADTINFFECLIAMDKSGLLENVKSQNKRSVVLEIGSGWGGLTYQFKTLFPNTTYVMVDLPPTLLFSITYLRSLFTNAKTLIVDGSQKSLDVLNNAKITDYDFVFIPHYLFNRLKFTHPDLLINRASFQEMKASEVDGYVKKSKEWGIPVIYSMNRDKSPHNSEMTSVRDVLARYYKLEEISIKEDSGIGFIPYIKKMILRIINGRKVLSGELLHRHVVARLK